MPLCSLVAPLAVSALALELAAPAAPLLQDTDPPLPPAARIVAPALAPATAPDARSGQVEYTTDPALERRVRRMLRERGVDLGHVIVMDPGSGELFAYVSTDPDAFPPDASYPAASLMKVVTAGAALHEAPDALARKCRYLGSAYELGRAQLSAPRRGGRLDSLTRALAMSNNQCFARLAVNDLGAEALLAEIRRLGLLESPGPRHPAGRVEPIRGPLDLGQRASGLAGSFISPLAGARLAAVLARGELVAPHWVAAHREAGGRLRALPRRAPPRAVWPPDLAGQLREKLVAVTEEGTARHAFRRNGRPLLGPIQVAGKTGSLNGERPGGLYQWFIGVAPAAEPQVAIAVLVVDAPVSASKVAAQTLRGIFCDREGCDAARAERLHGRARAREARLAREWARGALQARRVPPRAAAPTLDAAPRPLGAPRVTLPRRLLRDAVRGEIVLRVDLSPRGEVIDLHVDRSDLPDFEAFVVGQVRRWRFTPPTRNGVPVRGSTRLPIPIVVE